MSKAKKPTVAERAVRGVLGGWVGGQVTTGLVIQWADGSVTGSCKVNVSKEAIERMLTNERAEKAKKARRK